MSASSAHLNHTSHLATQRSAVPYEYTNHYIKGHSMPSQRAYCRATNPWTVISLLVLTSGVGRFTLGTACSCSTLDDPAGAPSSDKCLSRSGLRGSGFLMNTGLLVRDTESVQV